MMKTRKIHIYAASRLNRMHGFSLVSAIFLLIVLAGLGVAMVTISTNQHQSSSLDVQGVRAYQAARAGAEWGVFRWVGQGHACDERTTFPLPSGTSLSEFSVTVTCNPDDALEIETAVIRATACNMPGAGGCPNPVNNSNYVQRVVEVRL